MKVAFLLFEAVAVLFAWALARERRDHRPIAWLLSAGLAGSIAQAAFSVAVIAPLRAELGVAAPWTGWARVAGHVADALWLSWPAALVAAALVVFSGVRPWPAVVGWAGATAALVLRQPIAGDGSQGRFLGAAQALAVVISVGLAAAWARRTKRPVTPAQAVLTAIVANEVILLFGAWWAGPFGRSGIMPIAALLWLGLISLLQARFLWATRVLSSR